MNLARSVIVAGTCIAGLGAAPPALAAAGSLVVAALPALVPGPAPRASAQALPPCGAEQMEPDLESLPRLMYASHRYRADLRFDAGPATGGTPVNVQVTGPAGVLRKVSIDGESGQLELAPQAAGTLTLTVTWDQEEYWEDGPRCSASATLDLQVLEPLPITIDLSRRGTSANFESWPCGGAATCGGSRANRFGIRFYLAPGKPDRNGRHDWAAADLTPMRVEARAVARAERPSPAVEPAVLEFVPRARRPRRARTGLVEIVRTTRFPYDHQVIEIWVATRPGLSRRGLRISLSQGTRRLGGFALAGRCHSSSSLGARSTSCDFKGNHRWLSL